MIKAPRPRACESREPVASSPLRSNSAHGRYRLAAAGRRQRLAGNQGSWYISHTHTSRRHSLPYLETCLLQLVPPHRTIVSHKDRQHSHTYYTLRSTQTLIYLIEISSQTPACTYGSCLYEVGQLCILQLTYAYSLYLTDIKLIAAVWLL